MKNLSLVCVVLLALGATLCPSSTIGADPQEDDAKSAQELTVEERIDLGAKRLEEWYGKGVALQVLNADPAYATVHNAMRRFVLAKPYLYVRDRFEDLLSNGVDTWREYAAIYLIEFAASMPEGSGAPSFHDVYRNVRLNASSVAGSVEFKQAVFVFLAQFDSYRKEIADAILLSSDTANVNVLPTLRYLVKTGVQFEGRALLECVLYDNNAAVLKTKLTESPEDVLDRVGAALIRLCSITEKTDLLHCLAEFYTSRCKEFSERNENASNWVARVLVRSGNLEYVEKYLSYQTDRWFKNNSSRIFVNGVLSELPTQEARSLLTRSSFLAGEKDDVPTSYAERVRTLMKKLPGDQIYWNPDLRIWLPVE